MNRLLKTMLAMLMILVCIGMASHFTTPTVGLSGPRSAQQTPTSTPTPSPSPSPSATPTPVPEPEPVPTPTVTPSNYRSF